MSDLNSEKKVARAVDMLLTRQKQLIRSYEQQVFTMSQSFDSHKYKTPFNADLLNITDEIQFVSNILALIRDLPKYIPE